jgi:hypothetical protein
VDSRPYRYSPQQKDEIENVSVFAPARYRVVKIVRSSSEVALKIMKYIVIYLGLGPSLEVRDLRPVVWYIR